MTKRECAIVMAYTGVVMLQGEDLKYYYDYFKEKCGFCIRIPDEYPKYEVIIQKYAKEDFIKLCEMAVDTPDYLDYSSLSNNETVEDVYNTLNEKQKKVVDFLVGKASVKKE